MRVWAILLAVVCLAGGAFALSVGPFTAQQLDDSSTDPVFYNELGFQLAQEGRMGDAQAAFARAVELDPAYENARKNLYVAAFRNEDYATAIDALRGLPRTDQYTFDLAQALVAHARFTSQDADEAVGELEEALLLLQGLGTYPHAAENAAIIRQVLDDAGA